MYYSVPKIQLGRLNLPHLAYVTVDKDSKTPSHDYFLRSVLEREKKIKQKTLGEKVGFKLRTEDAIRQVDG